MATQAVQPESDFRPSLAEIFRARDRYARRGDVELAGTVIFLECAQGTISFLGDRPGPMLARLTDGPEKGAFVFLEPWDGLPPKVELTEDLCDACRIQCLECKGTGTRHCTAPRCGGMGTVITQWKACPACESAGKVSRNCQSCGGRGEVPAESYPCPACKGTKVEECGRCRGTGQMATGKKDRRPLENPAGPACEACKGSGRKIQVTAQNWVSFARGKLEGFTIFGPVLALVLRKPPAMNESFDDAGVAHYVCEPDYDANYPVLVSEDSARAEGRVYLFGGRIRRAQ
jgi:hypothetical protein